MAVTIRAGKRDDVAQVLALWATDDVEPTTTDDQDSVARLLDHDPEALLVAEADGQVVGTLIATWDGWRASMWRLAVQPDHRRRGIAARLVEHAERRFRSLGARRIATFVATSDSTPTDFWTAFGYQPQTQRRRFVKNLTAATLCGR